MKHNTYKASSLSLILVFILFCSIFSSLSYADDNATDAEALLAEGWRYFNGDGIAQDIPKGVSMIVEAANNGSTQAMLEVGYFYNLGLGAVISDDYVEGTGPDMALTWFKKVADAGDPETAGATIVSAAFDYFLGSDDGLIKEDDAAALKYFSAAADLGNPSALNMMGTFCIYGFGVEQDSLKALDYFSRLADQGDANALASIEEFAYAFYAGTMDGIDINFANSFAFYQKLAEYGNERAMYNLGMLYEYGLGVAPDHDKAVEWFTKASEAGFGLAADMLKTSSAQ